MEKYGMFKKEFFEIINVFKEYTNVLEKVILFGSRARGDYKNTSDIDIALIFRKNSEKIYEICEQLEKIDIIYKIDVVDYNKIMNQKFKNNIDNDGVILYFLNNEGEIMVLLEKIKDKLHDLKKAYLKLDESIHRNYIEDDIVLDASIQRFEFVYEMSWKLMKVYLEYNGIAEGTSPRTAIKESYKVGLIEDAQVWLKMLQDRNKTVHTYDEESAILIFENIKNEYIYVFNKFINAMDKEIIKSSKK
ncbi:HI0074 family nucleotidyltransferase substrate-binding subunit [Helicovermis profundi]|uniref:Polymerase beta nucleotidyltransferase domain-containing protein n=1 Tax=Helicovermis profundi TaxID=3065157 RepID=A0AAU9EUU3_9FIRM|nr:hypothetical protein HLPR_25510 [Clostridia bacterium S502]